MAKIIDYNRDESRCVLCDKNREKVKKLILGVHGGVCLECVELCNEIIRSDAAQDEEVNAVGVITQPLGMTSQWATAWLDGVADGSKTMSQRKLSSVEKRGGGIEAVKVMAEQRGVHLLLLEDEEGRELVAASAKPFQVVC